jgi:hypothetical protein
MSVVVDLDLPSVVAKTLGKVSTMLHALFRIKKVITWAAGPH